MAAAEAASAELLEAARLRATEFFHLEMENGRMAREIERLTARLEALGPFQM